uniref:CYRIA/CYRIB Rac1 binding domain-containing protein n=1 Tax=Plectus sambesii TaxID=2011161 RepID=A0A914UQ45_9BILA
MTSTSCAQMLRSVLRSQCESGADHGDEGIFVDFENAQPTETEQEVYQLTEKVLEQAEAVVDDLSTYGSGATEAIRAAIKNPGDARYQDDAWCSLLKLVRRLRKYYELSVRLEQVFPLLLWELCSGPLPPVEQLESSQALCKQFAQVLDFVLRFDELKMATPALQNDFSYYRRTMSRQSLAFGVASDDKDAVVPVDLANTISFFYASPTPMLVALTTATASFVRNHPNLPVENTTDTLATMAMVCRCMVETPEFVLRMSKEQDTRLFCLRVMVGAIILYDHVHPTGAFARGSAVDIRAAVRVLKNHSHAERVENLLNALRYTTKHLSDPTTPKAIRAILS